MLKKNYIALRIKIVKILRFELFFYIKYLISYYRISHFLLNTIIKYQNKFFRIKYLVSSHKHLISSYKTFNKL